VQTSSGNAILAEPLAQGKLEIVGREYLLESGRAVPVA